MSYRIKEPTMKEIILSALKEDIGERDITTNTLVPMHQQAKAILLVKEDCVICGLDVVSLVFKLMDKNIKFKSLVKEGDSVKKGKIIARISGKARSILTAERVALNFLTLLSGVATKTRKYVEAIKPYKTKIMDTRKTIPGLRVLEKYAVRIGGGYNHRLALDEMVLIKDNHLKVVGNRLWVIGLKNKISPKTNLEIEVRNLREFGKALKLNPDIIMLDNMSIQNIGKAVKIRNNLPPTTYHLLPKLEVSGGATLRNVKKIASCGVDMISVGELTHSIDSVDISLEIV